MLEIRSTATATNVSGTSASSVTVTKPSETSDGDLMLFITNGPVGSVTPPAGMTLLGAFVDGTATQSNLYKKIASSEGANYQFTFPSSSAVGVAAISFIGGWDVLTWDAQVEGTDSTPSAKRTDAARDSVAFMACAWSDTATNTVTSNQGSEQFDVASANTGSTLFRGIAGYSFGGTSDIVNAGDSMPGTTFTISSAPTGSVNWQILLGDKAPDTELWSSTNGDFAVEVKLDQVAVNDVGSIDTPLLGDITGLVSAFAASAEVVGFEVENLADGLASTSWFSGTATAWARYDFGTSRTARRYRLTRTTSAPDGDPMNWTLEGSANGTDFTVLDTRSNESFAFTGEVREFRVASPGAYRYYRLNVSSNRSPGGTTTVGLAEFRLSEIDVWEDVTSYVVEESKIRITRGLQGASGRSDFSRAYCTFNNTDGRFSLRKQDSPYYGALQRNTQMRISKAYGTKSLQLQGEVALEGTNMVGDCVRTPLTDDLQITGDIDIRVDLQPESWRDEQMLCGAQYNGSTVTGFSDESWSLYLDGVGVLHLTWHDGTTFWDISSEVPVPQTSARLAVRCTLDVNNGASGNTVNFYTSDTVTGSWTRLGDSVTSSGTTSISYMGGALCVGHVQGRDQRGIHGLVYHFELRDGIDGTLVTDIDFTALTNGVHSFTDSNSNRWVAINNAVVSNRRYRFHGEVAEWPLAWDPTGTWVEVSVTAAGVQRRMERAGVDQSVMRRYHTRGIISDPGAFERWATPYAYWPMEDQEGVFELASGLPSKPGMQIYGTPQFDQSDGDAFKESNQLIKLNLAKFGGRVAGNESGYADIRWLHHSPTGMADNAEVMEGYSTGAVVRWVLVYVTDNTWRLDAYTEGDGDVAAFNTGNQTLTTEGEIMHVRLLFDQDGSDLDISMTAYDVYGTQLGDWSSTFASTSIGRIYRVNVNPDGDIGNTYIGHLALYGTDSPTFAGSELNAHHYEAAGRRIERLCLEQRIDFRHVGDLDDTTFLGYQGAEKAFPVMSSAAVSDEGYLIDPLDAFGIEYRTLRSTVNQAAHLELSYTGNELSGELQPVADDGHLVNDFTASRGGAGSARARETSGPLSVNEPPDGVSEYEDSQSYSFAHEGQCVDMASWQVRKGTLDEDRYERVEITLENLRIAADTSLTESILTLDVGKWVNITDTPDFLPAMDIRQFVVGYEEWFDNFQHDFKLNTVPARWYESAVYDGGDHFAPDEASLYQDITSSATTVVVVSEGVPLTDDQEPYPFLVTVDGEVMRATARGSMITSNPFFDTDTTGWTTENATIARTTAFVHPDPTAVASLSITPNGVSAFVGALSEISADGTVSPQNDYVASFWAYSEDGYSDVRVSASWYTSASGFISTSTGSATAIPAGEWTYFEATFTAPATAARGRVRPRMNTTPAASDVLYVWAARLSEATPFYGNDRGDSFNRANSTTSLGSTDRGVVQAWTQDLGTWGISSNQAYVSASASSYATVTGTADFEEVSVTVPTWPSGSAAIIFRAAGGGAAENDFVRWGGTVGSAPVLDFVVATAVTRSETPDGTDFVLAAGDKLSARCNGSVVEVFVNDLLALCVSETDNQTLTQVGMRTTDTAVRFDNFRFRESALTQELQVERGYNGAAAAHKSQAEVALFDDPRRGL